MSDIDIFLEENEKSKIKFQNILNLKDIKMQIYKLEELLNENNTEPEFILKYLELKQEIKDENLPELLDTYKDCIFYETFNEKFGKIKVKVSFIQKLKELFEELKEINEENNSNKKKESIENIINKPNQKYKQTFPLFYSINKELFFNSLYYRFLKRIKKLYNKSKEKNKPKKFIRYIDNLSSFISDIYNDFLFLFDKDEIFLSKNYKENQKNKINLLSDFFSYLINYDFTSGMDLLFYSQIWNDTFKHKSFDETEISLIEKISFKKQGENLKVQIRHHNHEIKNIENYFIKNMLVNIVNTTSMLKDFDLDKYLRMNKYDSDLFVKSHWNDLLNYLVDIFCSKTITSLIKFLYPNDSIFLDKKIIVNILNNIRFFNYMTKFIAETKKRYLSIYIRSFPSKKNGDDNRKVVYLATFLITCFHEIVGHLFIRIHNYLNKNNQINSPKPKFGSDYAKDRGKESGEYIEELLFGNYEAKMTLFQILFILDKNNYSVDYGDFKKNFEKIKFNYTLDNISKDLNNILNLYEIEIDEIDFEFNEIYTVGKIQDEDNMIIEFEPHHSIE